MRSADRRKHYPRNCAGDIGVRDELGLRSAFDRALKRLRCLETVGLETMTTTRWLIIENNARADRAQPV